MSVLFKRQYQLSQLSEAFVEFHQRHSQTSCAQHIAVNICALQIMKNAASAKADKKDTTELSCALSRWRQLDHKTTALASHFSKLILPVTFIVKPIPHQASCGLILAKVTRSSK